MRFSRRLQKSAKVVLVCMLAGCSAAPPTLLSNQHLQSVGQVTAEQDAAQCREQARHSSETTKLTWRTWLFPVIIAAGVAGTAYNIEYGNPVTGQQQHARYGGGVLIGVIGGALVAGMAYVGYIAWTEKRDQETYLRGCLEGLGYEVEN